MPGIRSRALNKLAQLGDREDLERLADGCPSSHPVNGLTNGNGGTGRVPMGHKELENILALCKAAPHIRDIRSSTRLLQQLSPYLPESCYQTLLPSPFLRDILPSPWEILTSGLVNALFDIANRHSALRDDVAVVMRNYIDNCHGLSQDLEMAALHSDGIVKNETQHVIGVFTLATSLIGFLGTAARHASFWSADERFELIGSLQALVSERFLISCDTVFHAVRAGKASVSLPGEYRAFARAYTAGGRPLSALLIRKNLMAFIESSAALMLLEPAVLQKHDVLVALMSSTKRHPVIDALPSERIANLASQEIAALQDTLDYHRLGSKSAVRMACSVRASALISFLCCSLVDEESADPESLLLWLESSLFDSTHIADEELASATLRCLAVLGATSVTTASNLNRLITRFLTTHALSETLSSTAARCLLHILGTLPQDTAYNTLYSLGNWLSSGRQLDSNASYALFDDKVAPYTNGQLHTNGAPARILSSASLVPEHDENAAGIHQTVIVAVVSIASGFGDEKTIGLALSMLVQKVGKVSVAVDMKIIKDTAYLACEGVSSDFAALLKLYSRLSHQALITHNTQMLEAVQDARLYISRRVKGGTKLYELYLEHLLNSLISQGETSRRDEASTADSDLLAHEIGLLLKPLATLVKCNANTPGIQDVEDFPALQRDAWYNIVAHGFGSSATLLEQHWDDLQTLARYTGPLITEERASLLESDIDLNIVLRRGKAEKRVKDFRQHMTKTLPRCESEVRDLDYSELVFLEAVHLVESLRASAGDCTKTTEYFIEPHLKSGALSRCIEAVAVDVIDRFLQKTSAGKQEEFSAPFVAQQLSQILVQCCHRIVKVQQVAYICAARIIDRIPSALCQRTSVFTLLDLLTQMWSSCLEAESHEYEWRSVVTLPNTGTPLYLSDDYDLRRSTLRTLNQHAREWMIKAINTAPLDIKGLFQTYLSEYVEDEAFGHMSLGRSFAFEMGSIVPMTDQRLSTIDAEGALRVNTASDFMAQYTTRQEYRYTDPLRLEESDKYAKHMNDHMPPGAPRTHLDSPSAINKGLVSIEARIIKHERPAVEEMRNVLRRAAALLCRSDSDENATIALFVRIPFMGFTKQSIKFGLSLWMGVIKENPRMEPRILVEILENWIRSVRSRRGLFSERTRCFDPFYVKEEFAPSDREGVSKQQQRIYDLIAPHFRILQFLSSHYYASRLSNATVEKAYHRFLKVTLMGLRESHGHPLAREVHLHVLLLALRILHNSTTLNGVVQWRLKDDILSAGLAWFRHPPRWSLGGNRLQIKAESRLLADVERALKAVTDIGYNPSPTRGSLRPKQELLDTLLSSEQSRLNVWIFPLEGGKRPQNATGQNRNVTEIAVANLLDVAWNEDPVLAMALLQRFPSPRLQELIRAYVLKQPGKAVNEAEGVNILLGSSLPGDVQPQLKYLLYWAPVNPITAVSYFLPAYGNHPNIIQYAVRALESHSVDVTFFYVPQIVQALRYDALGYVERYIIETGKFSQLFAHQIIWNVKANSYKDEDATEPDPMKPKLDQVTTNLISSFAGSDKEFYQREFAFFEGVTGISGKLRPFLKRTKPEKKQKIEEELRAIQLDVGVYLPSNPDGVVVGIDRKSGKPLQSHAKTPYMATFRIRKARADDVENTDEQLQRVNADGEDPRAEPNTYEIWQSAIFKVGDDCRQDILALQMIAAFRGIFHHVGLPLYVFPYRVTATAPGCGVIDVLPNSISRDMLGREAVNGLYEWFVSRFGREEALDFQRARGEFVKSLAAYSIISFLLQFKDRHNGNIMFDEAGHILHIDFGFCFDIAPGGVKFERAPFKLTKEMVAVMGGSPDTQSFRWFEELCIKAFLAARMHVKPLVDMVVCMLDSGLPCFKPDTIKHFRERFVLEKSEREAAEFVRMLVRKSYKNETTRVYDQFQLMTNGIPY